MPDDVEKLGREVHELLVLLTRKKAGVRIGHAAERQALADRIDANAGDDDAAMMARALAGNTRAQARVLATWLEAYASMPAVTTTRKSVVVTMWDQWRTTYLDVTASQKEKRIRFMRHLDELADWQLEGQRSLWPEFAETISALHAAWHNRKAGRVRGAGKWKQLAAAAPDQFGRVSAKSWENDWFESTGKSGRRKK